MKAIILTVLIAMFSMVPMEIHAEAEAGYRKKIKVTPLLKTKVDSAGNKLVYPSGKDAEVTAVLVEIPPGEQTGWHTHPVPCFGYLLEGEVRVKLVSGEIKTIKAGEAFAEVVNVLHNGTNSGPGPTKIVMFVAGVEAQPYAVPAPKGSNLPEAASPKGHR